MGSHRNISILFLLCGALPLSGQAADYQAAVAYVQQGQPAKAIPVLQEILKATSSDLKARNLLGIALSASGRKAEAEQQFLKALELDPHFAPVLKNLAVNELALGKYGDAGLHFSQALKSAPSDPVLHFGMGEVDYKEKRYAAAVGHYEKSGDLYLKDPQATLRYARSCVELKKPAAAAAALQRLAPAADVRAHFEAGVLLAKMEKYSDAILEFRLAQPGYPDAYEAGYNLTLACEKGGDHSGAIAAAEQLIAQGYRKAELYNLLSQAYEHADRTKDAYQALRTATQLEPHDESNYVDLMELCLVHQNYDLSLEISEIALREAPRPYRVRVERGVVMAMKGEYEEAEKEFGAASESAGNAGLPYIALALVQMQLNKLPEAVALLRRRRRLDPKDYMSAWFLGEALSREGAAPGTAEEKEAVESLEDAARLNANASQPRTLLGKFLMKRGDLDRAAEAFESALRLDPADASATYQLALAYRKKGNAKRAEELFAKVSAAKAEARETFTQQNLVRIVREGTQ